MDARPDPARQRVHALLAAHLPAYAVRTVRKLGEGQQNVAYVANDELIVRLSKTADPALRASGTDREARLLALMADVSPLPVPTVRFADPAAGALAYSLLPGIPLLEVAPAQRAAYLPALLAKLREFLRAVQAVPIARVADLVDGDDPPLAEWLADAQDLYRDVVADVPMRYRRRIECFLKTPPPAQDYAAVFAHNDLGIEHVLIDPATGTLTGIIDWGDAAIADPAYDFGLLYRDLGPAALDMATEFRERAAFYARCSVFEDLAYGRTRGQRRYVVNGLAALAWLFPA